MYLNKSKILIVEDDNNLRNGLLLTLSSDTIETVEASTILAAKKLLETTTFDLILLDCNLPDGSGIDFCRTLRDTSNVPVIFLTVNDAEIEIVSAFRVGATDYVTKPFNQCFEY